MVRLLSEEKLEFTSLFLILGNLVLFIWIILAFFGIWFYNQVYGWLLLVFTAVQSLWYCVDSAVAAATIVNPAPAGSADSQAHSLGRDTPKRAVWVTQKGSLRSFTSCLRYFRLRFWLFPLSRFSQSWKLWFCFAFWLYDLQHVKLALKIASKTYSFSDLTISRARTPISWPTLRLWIFLC